MVNFDRPVPAYLDSLSSEVKLQYAGNKYTYELEYGVNQWSVFVQHNMYFSNQNSYFLQEIYCVP